MPNTSNSILGLHHVTATTEEAKPDFRFYTEVLGLHLVKKTVNFDDPKVYHFYYAQQSGTPGTVFTTFPYAGQGIRKGTPGHGQVYATAFSVPTGSLNFWEERLSHYRVATKRSQWLGQSGIQFSDPCGLQLVLQESADDLRRPWLQAGIAAPFAIRGLAAVILRVPDLEAAVSFLVEEMGFTVQLEEGLQALLSVGKGGAGKELVLWQDPTTEKGKGGMGTVHHVAFQVETLEELRQMRHRIAGELGIKTTEIKDRKYFQSIYFRFPGGVLFEIATSAPGFTVDEPEQNLGEKLMLPDWAEQDRTTIEAQLPKVED